MASGGGERKRRIYLDSDDNEPPRPPPSVVVINEENGGEEEPKSDFNPAKLSIQELEDKIARARVMLAGFRLPDGGEKLRNNLKCLEAELDRRMPKKVDGGNCGTRTPVADKSSCFGATEGLSDEAPLNVPGPQSTFASHFCRVLNDNRDDGKIRAFGDELSALYRYDFKNMKADEKLSSEETPTVGPSSRKLPFKSPSHLSVDEASQSNGEQSERQLSTSPLPSNKDTLGFSTEKTKSSESRPPRSSRRNNKSVVLVDEEELDAVVMDTDKVDHSMTEKRIYYPSRDDPEAIEICDSDVACLAPESFLSSNIMNFYIRYLQKPTSPPRAKKCDYHFFNTYFYQKLKQDVLNKIMQIDKETSFVKFRRWWKGVNLFEKAYIFLPIHENIHWSLVIVCIPDKEDESGPVILHLDSLGLHLSKSIFNDVKSFLIEEWKFLKKGEPLPELPIADKIWNRLSRRIDEKVIAVPQQKNEYDCGLFVLFFMERFIEDAPERLKKKDLDMFGRQWFRPEQASSLRLKIRDLLRQEFNNADKDVCNLD